MRLWVETDAVSNNHLKIAKIEFGQTNWDKLGFIDSELLNNGSTEFENDDNRTAYLSTINNEESIFFGDKGFGLRLYKPIPDLSISNHIQSRRSYITLLVDNLENIREKLELKDIKFIYKK